MFILKLDSSGNFVWANNIGAAAATINVNAIALDMSENVYTTGSFLGAADFDPGAGIHTLGSSGLYDVFITKFNSSGNYLWAKSMGGPSYDDVGTSIVVDASENVYTTGNFSGTADFNPSDTVLFYLFATATYGNDIFISKLDSAGNFIWAKNMGGIDQDYGNSIALDASDNIYTAGHFQGVADFDPNAGTANLTSAGGYDIFISKLDSAGNYIWARDMGGSSDDMPSSIKIDTLGNAYTIGHFQGVSDFDPGAGAINLTSGGNDDIFISKLDPMGNFVWAGKMGGPQYDEGNSIAVDASGNIYTTGNFVDTVDFNPSAGVFNLTSPGYESYAFVHKMLGTNTVWPGDADHNNIADNYDLLPIGIFFGQTGTPRATISNTWQAYNATDWGTSEPDGADIKHADCNGDGVIDNNDTLSVNLNFSLTHAFAPIHTENRMVAPNLYYVTSGSFTSGGMVDVEVWAGNSTTPVTNLYGLAFTINYDASLVQTASESLTYPTSWLGTPGTDAIKIGKIDALATKAYGAETRIDHANVSGFGKIADFKFQLKSSIPSNTVMHFSTAGYSANDATGTPMTFNTPTDSIIINPSSAGINEINNAVQISVYPNPTTGSFNLFTSELIKNGSIEVYNSLGEIVYNQKIVNQQNTIELTNQANGLYFVKVMTEGKIIGTKKIIKE